ncbi:SEL1-like repeat protein [Crenobacter intestini]|uniref:Sel1 repeat family protein n=1 Tax=Crenobacter intestini TaxID=2563443 RepID=A0A4T0UP35_9NEIS|nr:SEL1-like repeat protein [Crenobacter intestini]TIC80296.1 hypothetical protein E5K04_12375 [Crenobacter intestini]
MFYNIFKWLKKHIFKNISAATLPANQSKESSESSESSEISKSNLTISSQENFQSLKYIQNNLAKSELNSYKNTDTISTAGDDKKNSSTQKTEETIINSDNEEDSSSTPNCRQSSAADVKRNLSPDNSFTSSDCQNRKSTPSLWADDQERQAFYAKRFNQRTTAARNLLDIKSKFKLAEAGDKQALFELGEIYSRKVINPQNTTKSIHYYLQAANKGHDKAQFYIGIIYIGGINIYQDKTKGLAWLHMSAEQNNPDAMHAIGMMYYFGIHLPHYPLQGTAWLRKAAKHGHADAQSFLQEPTACRNRFLNIVDRNNKEPAELCIYEILKKHTREDKTSWRKLEITKNQAKILHNLESETELQIDVEDTIYYFDILNKNKIERVTITDGIENLSEMIIRQNRPLARSLMGATVGEQVELDLGNNNKRVFEIMKIERKLN